MSDATKSRTSSMTAMELRMLKCIREYRRLSNLTVKDAAECDEVHREADSLLSWQPELDDANEQFDAPHLVEHRNLVDSLFSKPNCRKVRI